MKKNTVLLYHLLLMIIFFYGCANQSEYDGAEPYPVMHPIIKDIEFYKEYVAEIEAIKNVDVSTRISGFIERIHVDEGAWVKEGQLLFTISSKLYSQEYQKALATTQMALAELKMAEIEFQNSQNLFNKNIVSKPELDIVQSKVEVMRAKYNEALADQERARLNLSFAEVKAPYNGIINRIPNKVGSFVEEGDELTSISDISEVFAYYHMSENDYLAYVESASEKDVKTVFLQLANGANYSHPGVIEIIEGEFDQVTGNIAFRARFPNPDRILKHGAKGKILEKESLTQVMIIPQKSTFEIQDQKFVFTIGEGDVAQQRKVFVSKTIPQYYVVQDGLLATDQIVFEGVQRLTQGTPIKPEHISADEIIKRTELNK